MSDDPHHATGKLKVFLGMCPGVGKTYAMLQAAGELRSQGVDVVAAVIETHGRKDTEALLAGLERLPMKRISYRARRVCRNGPRWTARAPAEGRIGR